MVGESPNKKASLSAEAVRSRLGCEGRAGPPFAVPENHHGYRKTKRTKVCCRNGKRVWLGGRKKRRQAVELLSVVGVRR
ncbi:hypothetical protein AGABI1DRAFT_112320 [Agaricus bisporus var. burnettii JB137-S8]|uniref:Uncharacterized protein n=1 Tax=Agaricus bisporus var. burnettii (strain JB137-S8 / ATCC MYA-4627 / FGSC 10392) TaxID=597362 RepID=K5X360_AGABU|nr:uncharacterized protein AGABI1DRAFT_112320 [Agaricus bisporus var. burnettii JB137-S8]EKM82271.1 hypothetical protein AGABI1DRAFT_112320 [Agaricus bisporus var. burnettii JB137-S8]